MIKSSLRVKNQDIILLSSYNSIVLLEEITNLAQIYPNLLKNNSIVFLIKTENRFQN